MPVENTAIKLVNEALLRLASDQIEALDEDTQKASICSNSYNTVIVKLLSMRQWRFATRKFELSQLTDAPIGDWNYAYQIPAEAFNHDSPWAVYASDAGDAPTTREYEIFEDKIYTDHPELFADFIVEPDVSKFPPAFRELAILALAEILAPTITTKPELAAYWGARAFGTPDEKGRGGWYAVAAQADARGNPQRPLPSGEIIDFRFS